MDIDRCGDGTPWGCGRHLTPGTGVHLVMNAATPVNVMDNGHRMFHPECFQQVAPLTQPYSRRLASHGA